MFHLYNITGVKLAFVFITLVAAAAANASLLDCTKFVGVELASGAECTPTGIMVHDDQSYVLKDAISAPPINTVRASFQVNQTRSASAIPESAPLLVLIGALLTVVLVRAKSCNTK